MEAFGSYLLKSGVWITGFAIIYLVFLRNERFFLLKRIYLISGILVSFIFPLITIHYQVELPAPSLNPDTVSFQPSSGIQPAHGVIEFNYLYIIAGFYLAGFLFLALRTGWHLRHLYITIRKTKINDRGPAKLIRASEFPYSFSFFNYVFVNPSVSETEVEEILNHELVHVNQKHWFDLLLSEILRLIQWANPFAWIYTGFIRLNHEYLADEIALKLTSDPVIYKATLLNQMFRSPVISLSNSFNYSLNKKRFDMMKKIIVSPYRKLKVLMVIPVFAVVFYAFATPDYHYPLTSETDNTLTIYQSPAISVMTVKGEVLKEDRSPLSGVTIVVSGTSLGVITGAEGKFTISNVPGDATLTFFCKGYLTQNVKAVSIDMVIHLLKDPAYREEVKVTGYGTGMQAAGSVKIFNATDGSRYNPLIIIDGEITDRKNLDGIDPDIIDSIEILKDQAAAAYGEKGKNGVILITTRNKLQNQVKGVVVREDGKPLEGVNISSTGTSGNVFGAITGQDGRFSFVNLPSDASLLFFFRGYKQLTLKPDFTKEMTVKMEKDPKYKEPEGTVQVQRPIPIVTVDGVITDKSSSEIRKELGYNMGIIKMLMGKEATDKYGEKGINGVMEIITRKKALEMGLKPPFPRLAPEDYPTFRGQRFSAFNDWVARQIKYPAEAQTKKIGGWVSVNFEIELDGSLRNLVSTIPVDPILRDEVLSVVQSSPKWDPPRNPDVDEPFTSGVTLRFKLPDHIESQAPYVVVEKMPMYPGGDAELLDYIKKNTIYPEKARIEKIEGRVIVRFVVTKEGTTEAISVLKGVDPLLDAEAIRVVSTISGWEPGSQGGNPVHVWYMVPITFSLAPPAQTK